MEKIILEMLSRIKTLEEEVEKLKKGTCRQEEQAMEELIFTPRKVGLTESARLYIAKCKNVAKEKGLKEITLLCNDIQKALGVVNRPTGICTAMYDMMEDGDEVISAPPSGMSTTVKVKYLIK